MTGRRRKKKCDETRLQCLNCKRQNINCVWQISESQPNVVLTREQNLASESETRKEALDSVSLILTSGSSPRQPAKVEPPRICLDDLRYDKSLTFPSRLSDKQHLSRISFTQCAYSSAITPESRHLFHYLQWKFLPELIRPAAENRVIDLLSKHTLTLALEQPFCMHALLACCGAEIPTHDPTVRELARFHYTRAITTLRPYLNDGNIQNHWIVTMLTVMMLCIYEVGWMH